MHKEHRCTYPGCEPPLKALPRQRILLSTGERLSVCRKHNNEINQLNAEYIGHCEWRTEPCDKRPITMATPPGSRVQLALCRTHKSIVNEQYATMRKGS